MRDYDILILPGGFSYGDALGAGVRLALDMRAYLQDQILEFADRGKMVVGICNGFQALVKSGLLPGDLSQSGQDASSPAMPTERSVTLTENAHGRFECRWVHLLPNPDSASPLIRTIAEPIFCPVAHGEGRFRAHEETVRTLRDSGCIAFQYASEDGRLAGGAYPANPNGSVADIAGISNPAGNVLGLMPHPEDHIASIQNPSRTPGRLGLQLFQSIVDCVR